MQNLNDFFNQYFIESFFHEEIGLDDSVILDLGCGSLPYRHIYKNRFAHIVASDFEIRGQDVDLRSDCTYLPFRNSSFDAILFSEVIEHISDYRLALAEISRVLKPGGKLIITWPFIYQMHELPYDFRRFTEFEMANLLVDNGLRIEILRRRGDIFSVLHTIIGILVTYLIEGCRRIPFLGKMLYPLTYLADKFIEITYRVTFLISCRAVHIRPSEVGGGLRSPLGFLALWTLGYCAMAKKDK